MTEPSQNAPIESTIEFYHDFGSMNAYFVHNRLPDIQARYGVHVQYRPILLGGLFKAIDNQAPFLLFSHLPSKLAYFAREQERYAERHQIPYLRNPHFPVMSVQLLRAAIYAEGQPYEAKLIDSLYRNVWADGLKMDDPEVFAHALDAAGLPREEILAGIQQPEVKQTLKLATEEAADRGVFGAPTLFFAGEMFFGKESLADLEYVLETDSSLKKS